MLVVGTAVVVGAVVLVIGFVAVREAAVAVVEATCAFPPQPATARTVRTVRMANAVRFIAPS